MTKAALTLTNLSVSVPTPTGNKTLLDNINLNLNSGDFVIVLGTNGAGKSTLFNAINGTILPSSGSVALNNVNLTKLSQAKRAKFIAQVFQDPKMGTAPRMTVAENLLLAIRRGKKRRLLPRRLAGKLKEFKALCQKLPNGLDQRLFTECGQLSGGQRQTLSFLMATINTPELLLLDEHTAALDPKTARQLLELTATTIKKQHLTAMMITHDLTDACRFGNRLIILNEGKIVFEADGAKKAALTPTDLLPYFTN